MAEPTPEKEDSPAKSKYNINIVKSEHTNISDNMRIEINQDKQASKQPVPPTITVTRLTDILSTAYCRHLDADSFPFVTVAVDNTDHGCGDATIRASVDIEEYSDTAVMTLSLAQGEHKSIPLLPLLRPAAVAQMNEIRPATLHILVEEVSAATRILYERSERIHLQARDVALLGIQSPKGSIIDLTRYLAAWVTPRRPEIEQLLRKAARRHPDQRIVGYQGANTPAEGATIVREQARAIFSTLKIDSDLAYINSPLSLGAQAGQIAQRVRLPVECLVAGGSANCLDGTVLFASLLELASIDPLIVIVPGHAFVGWRMWQGVERYEFLETTMIAGYEFEEAQQAAQWHYEAVLQNGMLTRGMFDPGGFARLIDVTACRAQGIYPLD